MVKCEQCKWKKIDEELLTGWWSSTAGRVILFQCEHCGKLQKVKLDRNDH